MKAKNRIKSKLLVLFLSLTIIVTYLPTSMIAYAADDITEPTVTELSDDSAVETIDSSSDDTVEAGEPDSVAESEEEDVPVLTEADEQGGKESEVEPAAEPTSEEGCLLQVQGSCAASDRRRMGQYIHELCGTLCGRKS